MAMNVGNVVTVTDNPNCSFLKKHTHDTPATPSGRYLRQSIITDTTTRIDLHSKGSTASAKTI